MVAELKLIKEVISNSAKKYNIAIDKIILFGSRARGDNIEDSDWDLLIVTKEKLDWRKRRMFLGDVLRSFAKMKIKAEVLVIDAKSLEEYGKWKGFVYYYAINEGIKI